MRLRAAFAALAVAAAATASAAGERHTVVIEGMKFVPERLEVRAGDTVTWTNRDVVPHTVTSAAARVESGDLGPGGTWTMTAARKGEIRYVCRLHPGMRGLLIVK
jgi:plastocyanin